MLLQPKMKHPIVKLLLSCIYSKTIFFYVFSNRFYAHTFSMLTVKPCVVKYAA